MENFTQKEILLQVMEKMDEATRMLQEHTTKLEAIKEQTTKTNGRVTRLEESLDTVERIQENLAVKVGAGVFLATTIVAIFFNKYLL